MPIWTWLTPATTSSPTCGSASAATYVMQAQSVAGLAYCGLANNQTTSTSGWVVYRDALAGNQVTSATTANTIAYWSESNNTVWWEDGMEQAQYVALAQQRVALNQAQILALQQQQAELAQRVADQAAVREVAHRMQDEQRKAARAKSRELLLKHLTPEQRRTFEVNQWFIVRGGKTNTRYRIRTTGYTGNIDILRGHDDHATHRLCGHLCGSYALHDHHVAQKISLEYDEDVFVRLCNRSVA